MASQDEKALRTQASSSASSSGSGINIPFAAPESGQQGLAPALLTAFCFAVGLLHLPSKAIRTDLDSSWQGVLPFAHAHGWQWGQDIVFTFGPLSSLLSAGSAFAGAPTGTTLLLDLVMTFAVMAGVCLLARRLPLGWRLLFFGLLVCVFLARDTLAEVGLVCWGLLCVLEPERHARCWRWVLAGLAAALALYKFNLALAGGATVLTISAWEVVSGKKRAGLELVASSLALFLVGWVLLGQNPLNLWRYAITSLELSSGYGLTMSVSAPREIRMAGVIAALLTLLVIGLRTPSLSVGTRSTPARVLLPAWLCFATFLAWKHGFVRADGHEAFFFGFAAALTVGLEALPGSAPRLQLVARGAAIVVVLLACATMEWRDPGVLGKRMNDLFPRFARNLRNLIYLRPYRERMNGALADQRRLNQLPKIRELVGRDTLDVFGQNQAFALFNDLNYHPRPVFQSYSAYTAPLMKLNQRYYESASAPEFVLFNLSPLDERLPALEDSGALRTLLTRYRPVAAENTFLLFKRSDSRNSTLSLLRQGTARAGEPIWLDDPGDADLWMEIDLRPRILQRIGEFLYRPSTVSLCAWLGTPPRRGPDFRAPAAMLAAGCIVRPLLTDTPEVVDLYTGGSNTQPTAVSIEMSSDGLSGYRQPFSFRLYRITPSLRQPPDLSLVPLRWPGFVSFPVEVVATAEPSRWTNVGDTPALCVQPGGCLKFKIPPGATQISGAYGFEEIAYTTGTTDGAEFRIELQSEDGSVTLLKSALLEPKTRPEDRGLISFVVPLPAGARGDILLKVLPGPNQDAAWDLTCWASIQIK